MADDYLTVAEANAVLDDPAVTALVMVYDWDIGLYRLLRVGRPMSRENQIKVLKEIVRHMEGD